MASKTRKGFQASPEGWSRDLWRQYAELGLLGVPFAEADGGFGGGPVETMLIMEAFGKALALEPYLATVVLAGGLIRRAGNEEQRAALIPAIAVGRIAARFRPCRASIRARSLRRRDAARARTARAFVLNGEKGLVLHGDSADKLIVSARTAGGAARSRRASACSWSTPTPTAFRGAAIARRTACAPPRSR